VQSLICLLGSSGGAAVAVATRMLACGWIGYDGQPAQSCRME
jgi:hypothetical protein